MVDFTERDTRYDGEDETGDENDDADAVHEEDPVDPLDAGHDKPADHEHDHGHDHDHDHHHHDVEHLGIAVLTVSSSRTLSDDPSGDRIVEIAEAAGHDVVTRELVEDDYDHVQHAVDTFVKRRDVDTVITTGGTGVTPDDVTIEAIRPLFRKELPGFGELFRILSYEEIDTKVIATRATAGIANGVPVFCLPGSENAVQLAVEEIILEEAGHLSGLATRELDSESGTEAEPEPELE
ncbi:MAG: molybdenum cofactor biosynthesis protein B [Halobacteriales archaeon]